jgi:hypothetical protein
MQVSPGIQYGARVLHYGGKAASRTTKFLRNIYSNEFIEKIKNI